MVLKIFYEKARKTATNSDKKNNHENSVLFCGERSGLHKGKHSYIRSRSDVCRHRVTLSPPKALKAGERQLPLNTSLHNHKKTNKLLYEPKERSVRSGKNKV